MSKRTSIIFLCIAFLGALMIGTYIRLYPLRTFESHDTKEKATVFVISKIKSSIANTINIQYAHLSADEKIIMEKKLFNDALHENRLRIQESIQQVSKNIQASSSTHQKTPYLLASDSFYYLQLTKNILKTGHLSPQIKGSKYLNTLMSAPLGFWEPLNLHPFVGAGVYLISRTFVPDIPLDFAVGFTPLIIVALSLLLYFIVAKNLKSNVASIFTSSIFLLTAPSYIKRSTLGWYDNDPYNIFFPLVITLLLFKIIDGRNKTKNPLFLSFLLSLTFIVYSLFWQGWVFIFSVTFASLLLMAGYEKAIHLNKGSSKYILKSLSVTALGSFIGISLIFGIKDFFVLFKEGFVALKNFLNPQLANWPDLYITVGELKKSSFAELASLLGGQTFLIISVIGICIVFINAFRHKKIESILKLGFLLTFLASSLFITLGAQRFGLILLLPLSLSFGITLSYASEFITHQFPKKSNIISFILSLLIISFSIFPIVHIQKNIQKYLNPIFNTTWEEALLDIKERTPTDSIINTWWPPGHFIKAIAERSVTFDGASINTPQSYWLSKFLLSQDETAALGILRMLNSSANQAAEFLINEGLSTSKTVELLTELTKHPLTIARLLALKALEDPEKSKALTDLTHGTPKPSYILLYNEFVDNNIQLKFVADWNFKEIEAINKDPNKIALVPKRTSSEYLDFLWSLAGGMHKYSGAKAELKRTGADIIFEDDITLNLNSRICTIYSSKFGKGLPSSIFILDEDGTIKEQPQPGIHLLPYSVVFIEEQGKYIAYLMDRHVAKSMLMQMYLFDAKGLNAIKHFGTYQDLTKRTIIKVFEVNWN